MAVDASIKHIEELSIYSSHLQSFCDSIVKNGTSYSNLMVQKMEILQKKKKQAEEMVKKLSEAATEAENSLAYRRDDKERPTLLKTFQELHDRYIRAKKLLSDINLMIVQAQGATRCIIEKTRNIQNEIIGNVEQGRSLLNKSRTTLEQYQEGINKI